MVSGNGISFALPDTINILKSAGYDIFIETYGTGQPDMGIVSLVDQAIYVTTPDLGGATQIAKEWSLFWQWIQLPPHPGARYWQTVSPSCTRQIKTGSTPAECLLEAWLLEGRAMVFHLPCPTPSIF